MAQHDMVVDNGSGLTVRQDVNAALQALATLSSGPVAPTNPWPGMYWLDTAPGGEGVLRQRNLANSSWILPGATIDTSAFLRVDGTRAMTGELATPGVNVTPGSPISAAPLRVTYPAVPAVGTVMMQIQMAGSGAQLFYQRTAAFDRLGMVSSGFGCEFAAVSGANEAKIKIDGPGNPMVDFKSTGGEGYLSVNGIIKYRVGANFFAPNADNDVRLGFGSLRWITIYAVSGTINTSDARQKTDVRPLEARELAVGRRLKGLVKAYRWRDAVAKKGEGARIHVGVIAQEVEAAFAAEGLEAEAYGVFCRDELEDGDVLGVRYDELFAFIIAAL